MTAAHDTTQAAARIPTERVRELLALTPGPFGGTLVETSMVRDLAADLLDARSERDALAAALRTERAAREVAEASAALSARAAVDAARELGHVAAAAVARADAADAQHAALAGAVRAERERAVALCREEMALWATALARTAALSDWCRRLA